MKGLNTNSFAAIRRTTTALAIAAVTLFTTQGCDKDETTPIPTLNSDGYKTLNTAMRKAWGEHMQWTYANVDAFFNNPAAVQAHLDRLLKNQKDIGAAIVPYYGQAAGDTLAALLTTHISQAPPVLQAAKDNNQAALDAALAAWYANAEDIADFLSAANPQQWPQAHLRDEMKGHIDQTTTYAVHLLQQDYTKAVTDYETAFNHMMHLADELSEGIAKQFPEKF
ncbi:MAG TPA: hypothetical protein VEB42_03245 [Chitinophagaceae bacterium]|nr:hypothetical protein [Chitinophagaceae bacterium]